LPEWRVVFPLILFVQGLSMLIGQGASSIISLRLGEGRKDEAEAVVGTGTTLGIVGGGIVVIVTGIFMRPLLAFFGGSGVVLDYAMRFTLNNMIRGQGDPVTALFTMVISAGVNCVLNPVFIFGLKLGIAGSALATDIAQAVVVVWLLLVYLRTKTGLRLRAARMRPARRAAADLLGAGAAPCVMQLATGASLILANRLVAEYGGDAGIAVLGIASSLVNLMLMPIIGYNYGAKAYGRVRSALSISIAATAAVCAAAYALGIVGLRVFLSSIPVVGVTIIGSVYFQSIKKPISALAITLIRQLVVLVPLYFILSRSLGLLGVWLAGPISDFASVALTLALLIPEMRRLAGEGAVPEEAVVAMAAE
jgi:Na+-driven multidrug efflux pump